MKFENHFLTGLPLIAAIQIFFYLMMKEINIAYLIISSVSFIAGTVLPDIDLKTSKIHKSFRFVIYPLSFVFGFYFVYPLVNLISAQISVLLTIAFSVLVIISYEYVLSKKGFRHRGFLHTLPAAVLYGFLIFFISRKFNLIPVHLFCSSFLGFFGWYFHEMTDKIWSRFHKKRF